MTKIENRKEKTVVLLIDFLGHPILGEDYVNNRRYSELQRLSLGNNIDKEKIIIVSNMQKNYDKKLTEIMKMAGQHYGFKTLQIDEPYSNDLGKYTIKEISNMVFEVAGWHIKPSDTQIVIGGCNLGGCVINAKPFSAVHWAQLGFKTVIHLPLCAEYEQPGVNSTERAYNAFKQVYDKIQEYETFNNIQLTDKFEQLKFSFYEKEFSKDGTKYEKR